MKQTGNQGTVAAPHGEGMPSQRSAETCSLLDELNNLLANARQIGSRIAQLNQERARSAVAVPFAFPAPPQQENGDTLILCAAKLVEQLRGLPEFGAPALFGNRCWLLILELFVASHAQRAVSVKEAAFVIGGPPTTAQRKLISLETSGILISRDDEADRRRRLVELSPEARVTLTRYLCSYAEQLRDSTVRLRLRRSVRAFASEPSTHMCDDWSIEPDQDQTATGFNSDLQS